MSEHTRISGIKASALLLAVLIAVGLLVGSGKSNADDGKDEESATTTTMPSKEEDERECPETWIIVQVDHEQNVRHRFYDAGLREIFEADTDEEARDAAHTWLGLVRRDPEYFAGGAVSYFLHRQVDPATLVDAEGKCASALAEQLLAELETAFALARITPSEAPENGYNSGVNDDNVVGASNPGISGDRTAILIELPDGTKVWILGRCGNPVTEGQPPLPPGKTDNPPTTTTVPPSTTTTKPPTSEDCQQNGTGPNCPFPPVQQPPQDNDTSGVNTGPTPGAPAQPPPSEDRPSGDPNGGSGDGGAPPPTGPTDDSDADEVTEPPPDGSDPCPFGPGNC